MREKILEIITKLSDLIQKNKIDLSVFNTKNKLSKKQRKEINEFWRNYNIKPYNWVNFYYESTGDFDVRYIPHGIYFTKIDKYFNARKQVHGIKDKNYYEMLFPTIKHPRTIARKINGVYLDKNYHKIKYEEIITKCIHMEEVIIKPSIDNGGGKGINFWIYDGEASLVLLDKLLDNGDNLIIQEVIEQHDSLNALNESSINTIRVITCIFKGNTYHLSSVVRIGREGSRVDNASLGGISCGIEPSGRLKSIGYTIKGKIQYNLENGKKFDDISIPSYEIILEKSIEMQESMPHFSMISWDFSVDKAGDPILVEANYCQGGIYTHQLNNGPLFGDKTREILDEILGRN